VATLGRWDEAVSGCASESIRVTIVDSRPGALVPLLFRITHPGEMCNRKAEVVDPEKRSPLLAPQTGAKRGSNLIQQNKSQYEPLTHPVAEA